MGIFYICKVRHWCCTIKPGSQSLHQFIPNMFDGVEFSALCGPVKFFHTKLIQPCLYGPCFVYWRTTSWNRKGPSPNCSHKFGSIALSKMSWQSLKNSFSLHNAVRQVTLSWHLPNPVSAFRLQKCDLSLHVSTAQEFSGSKLYTTPSDAWKFTSLSSSDWNIVSQIDCMSR